MSNYIKNTGHRHKGYFIINQYFKERNTVFPFAKLCFKYSLATKF